MTTSRNVASRMRDTVYFLNMSDNYIGPDGVLSIAEAIKLHRCRSTVFLRNVKCDSAGALALSATGSLIHGLDLSQNSLEDLHVIDGISCMLSQSTVLESLYLAMLSDNPVSTSQFNRIGKRTIRKEEGPAGSAEPGGSGGGKYIYVYSTACVALRGAVHALCMHMWVINFADFFSFPHPHSRSWMEV